MFAMTMCGLGRRGRRGSVFSMAVPRMTKTRNESKSTKNAGVLFFSGDSKLDAG